MGGHWKRRSTLRGTRRCALRKFMIGEARGCEYQRARDGWGGAGRGCWRENRNMRLPFMHPMVLVEAKAAFDDPDFVFEAKLDGFRAVAYIQGGQCELISRKKHAYRAFDGLARELGASIKDRKSTRLNSSH